MKKLVWSFYQKSGLVISDLPFYILKNGAHKLRVHETKTDTEKIPDWDHFGLEANSKSKCDG